MSDLFNGVYRGTGDNVEEDNFNEPLNDWNVSKVTDMARMFSDCYTFNQPLDSWNVSNVRNMSEMFAFCESFNQPLNMWDVRNVTDMRLMFVGADEMDEQNMPSVENYNEYLELLEAGKTAVVGISNKKINVGKNPLDETDMTKEPPLEIIREIIERTYPEEIVSKVLQPGMKRGENYKELLNVRNKNAAAQLPPQESDVIAPTSSGETASDALGGRTRRRRHGKRKSKKSKKSMKTKKRRYSKRR
jgi:surface protein